MLAPRIPYSTLRVNTVKGKPRTWFALVLATSLSEIGFRILCLKGSLGGFLEFFFCFRCFGNYCHLQKPNK